MVLGSILACSMGIFNSFESVGHFRFTFNYFEVVMMIPYVIENKKMPNKKKTCMMIYYWAWRIANLTLAVLYVIYTLEYSQAYIDKSNEGMYKANKKVIKTLVGFCFLNLLSCLQLAYTVYRIKRII